MRNQQTQTLSIRLPAPLHDEIASRADEAGVSTSVIARELLRRALAGDDLDRRIESALRRVLDDPQP